MSRVVRPARAADPVGVPADSAPDHLSFNEDRFQEFLDSLHEPHVMFEPVRVASGTIVDFVYVEANTAACEYHHFTRSELIGITLLSLVPSVVEGGIWQMLTGAMESGEPSILVDSFITDNGVPRDFRYDIRAVRLGSLLSVTWRDVTERNLASRLLEERERELRLLADNMSDVVMRLHKGVIKWISPSIEMTLGGTMAEWLDTKLMRRVHPDDVDSYRVVGSRVRDGHVGRWRGRLRSFDSVYQWVEIVAGPYRPHRSGSDHPDGTVDGSVVSLRVVDDQVAAERELERLARTDPLTGALNRREAIGRLQSVLESVRRTGPDVGVLFCDVDKFKRINDTYGHAMGDHVLVALVRRIDDRLRGEDIVARMGGDELLIVLSGLHGIEDAEHIAEDIHACTDEPIVVGGTSVKVSLSIGATIAAPGENPDAVISRADAAMYRAKVARHDT